MESSSVTIAAGARGPGDALFEIEADELRRIDVFGQPLQTIDAGGAIVDFGRGAFSGLVPSRASAAAPNETIEKTKPNPNVPNRFIAGSAY